MDRHAIKEVYKEHKGKRYLFPLGVLGRNVETDSEHRFISDAELKELGEKPGPDSPLDRNTVNFAVAANRANIQSGDTQTTLFGKIAKWLNDLKAAAFCDVTQSLGVTEPGTVLDGRVGKAINDKFGGMSFYEDATGKYVVGADGVKKKLGSVSQAGWTVVGEEYIGDESGVYGGLFIKDRGGYIIDDSRGHYGFFVLGKDYDIKPLRADYAQLTADNFITIVTEFFYENYNEGFDDPDVCRMEGPSIAGYNPATGMLSVKSGFLYCSSSNHGYSCGVKARTLICG